jgi:hypothetical protein
MQKRRGGPAAAARAVPDARASASPENKRLQSVNRGIPAEQEAANGREVAG